jgi:hypothetical protein
MFLSPEENKMSNQNDDVINNYLFIKDQIDSLTRKLDGLKEYIKENSSADGFIGTHHKIVTTSYDRTTFNIDILKENVSNTVLMKAAQVATIIRLNVKPVIEEIEILPKKKASKKNNVTNIRKAA